jgi:hypothetical protein
VTRQPVPVALVLRGDTDDVAAEADVFLAGMDDAYWHRFVRAAFSWRLFTEWWVARRWIVPTDPRRRE